MKYGFYGDVSSRSTVQNLLHLFQQWARREQSTIPYPVSEWSTVIIRCHLFFRLQTFIFLLLSEWHFVCISDFHHACYISQLLWGLFHTGLRVEPSRAEPKRKAPNWNDPNWYGSDNTPTFLKVIYSRCVTDHYLFCDNTVTHNTTI
jgi:hypothetical protein